eukprot:jgi/Ulvmu1/12743/UM095_0048.1
MFAALSSNSCAASRGVHQVANLARHYPHHTKNVRAQAVHRRDQLALAALWPFTSGQRSSRPVSLSAASTDAAQVLEAPNWPEKFPFRDEMFNCYDESSDVLFYDSPRFVTHIDDNAIKALTHYYASQFPSDEQSLSELAVLDMCSSWISHYPKGFSAKRVAGLGMNAAELERNPILTETTVVDLNVKPELPYEDNSFDFITNAVSVDYLRQPLPIFREMHRVLKPGGKAIMSFSNRCFPTKAIAIWTSTGDLDHLWIVGSYFHYCDGEFTPPVSKDITLPASQGGRGDPMYVVEACKV